MQSHRPTQDGRRPGLRAALAGLLLAFGPGTAHGQGPASDPPQEAVAELRAEIEALKREYEERIARLEARLAEIEGAESVAPAAEAPAAEDDELAALRAAARAAAGASTTPAPEPPGAPSEAAVGRERNLNRLNPEISFTGIVSAAASDAGREEFRVEEFELDLQANLDPFSRTRWTLAYGPEEGEVEIEEAWIDYTALPGGLELMAGKFRQRFGALNRQHLHALPQTDYPLALTTFFGEETLAQTGVSLTWRPRRPWASANELTLEITDGENEAFGGELFEELAVLARLKSFWDLSPAAWFEWGLSGIAGETPEGGDSRVWGTDLTWHWQPPRRAKYREITWRTELLFSRRDDPFGVEREAFGAYTYGEGLLARNLYLGLRLDYAEDPLEPSLETRAVVPYLTWWQSEYVRLRGELRRLEGDLFDSENQLVLQLTWAAGPHKHETY